VPDVLPNNPPEGAGEAPNKPPEGAGEEPNKPPEGAGPGVVEAKPKPLKDGAGAGVDDPKALGAGVDPNENAIMCIYLYIVVSDGLLIVD
jgi:hypothetical protein